jgi:class 3 adenylate cyclase
MSTVETVTVLFTDLVGSTDVASRMGPDRAEELRQEHFDLLHEAIVGANGREVKNIGDGVMAAFPSAAAAVECALAMQQRSELRNRRADDELQVRIGLSMGDATRADGDYFGTPVTEAARLCAEAHGGQVLLSDVTRVMVGGRGDHAFSAVGALKLKGLPDPVAACELVWDPLPAGGLPLPARLTVLPETGYIGREQIRARLDERWELARSGTRQVTLLAGEPGIGKTRLATHVALGSHAEGATVLYGRCDEEIGAAYQPWVEALADLARHAPLGVLKAHVSVHGGELRRLLPEVRQRVPDAPAPTSSDPETERYMLFRAITGLLRRAATDDPIVLVLDDLQWADKPSLALLRYVVKDAPDTRLLLIASYRESDITSTHPLSALLADLRNEQTVEWIELEGLDRDEVLALVEAAAGHELDADGLKLAQAITRETDGNPFFVGEMLRHLVESGGVVQRSDGRYVVTADVGELGLPRSVRDVIGRRLRRLGPQAIGVLSAGAVIGREFDLELLELVAEHGDDDLLAVLEGAVAGSVLRESSNTPGRFAFEHALINHTLYEELGPTRRARLHHEVAQALEELCGDDPGERLGELANHWAAATQAVDLTKAVSYARLAGERALSELAPDEALRWFNKALELQGPEADADPSERCDLLIGLGEAQRQTGEPPYRETLLEASQIASQLEDADLAARAALANNRGLYSATGELDQERLSAIERAIELDDPPHPARRARLLALQAQELVWDLDFARRQSLCDEAISLARGVGDARTLAEVLRPVLFASLSAETLEPRTALARELCDHAATLGDPALQLWAHAIQGDVYIERCELARAQVEHEQARAIAEELGQPTLQWLVGFRAAGWELMHGDLVAGERVAERTFQIGQEAGQPDAVLI